MKFDAIIIGAGAAGSVTALALARSGWNVAVVEKSRFPRQKVCGEFLSATNIDLLAELGMYDTFASLAGAEVTSVSLYAGNAVVISPMPPLSWNRSSRGRALGRDQLDTLLLNEAVSAGATAFQPYSAVALSRIQNGFKCRVVSKDSKEVSELEGGVIISAHGSWESGNLPTQPPKTPAAPGDMLGFKARFQNASLPSGTMPLLVFPGGYGGMVHTDGGRVSLSCCIRRDHLERLRQKNPSASAGEIVLAHIKKSCRGTADALAKATLDGQILSVGPLRPGIRKPYRDGIFCVGNAVGEAHPIVAEGISMAMQAGWLLAQLLTSDRKKSFTQPELDAIGREYTALWKMNFASRIRAASCFAHLAMRPVTAGLILPLIKLFPGILTIGARWSGKANRLVMPVPAMTISGSK